MSRGKRRRFRNRGRRKAERRDRGSTYLRDLFDLQTRKDEILLEAFDAWFRDYLQNFPAPPQGWDDQVMDSIHQPEINDGQR